MAEIHYHGIGNSGSKSRLNEMRAEIFEMENQRMKSLVISRTEVVCELNRIGARITRVVEESGLEKSVKEELKRTWATTRKKILSSRTDMKTLLKAARALGPEPEEPNGA